MPLHPHNVTVVLDAAKTVPRAGLQLGVEHPPGRSEALGSSPALQKRREREGGGDEGREGAGLWPHRLRWALQLLQAASSYG